MDNLERKIEKGSLYKLDKNFKLIKVDKNYRITNGPAFIDQYNFYHTDSAKKNIYKIKIDQNQNAQEISEKLSALAAEKILDNVDDILEDKAKFIDQDHSKATYAKKIDKEESRIDWDEDASKIIGKINGLFPSPGASFSFNGEIYKILKAEIGNGIGQVGEIISNQLEVACNKNQSIKILEIQRQGKRPQKISEFMLGSQIKKGSKLSNV